MSKLPSSSDSSDDKSLGSRHHFQLTKEGERALLLGMDLQETVALKHKESESLRRTV